MSVVDKYRGERSLGGFGLDLLKSGLQKYIRRGDIQKAVKCGLELNTFRLGKDRGETIRTNFFHRLQIILLEDVCNISLVPYISECLERYNRYRDTDKEELKEENRKLQEGLLIHVITLMCESKKSRICSHVRSVCNDEYKNYRAKFNINEFDNCLQENYTDNFKKAFIKKDKKCIYYAFKLHHSDTKLEKRVSMSYNGKKFGGIKQLYVIFYELSRVMNIDTYIRLYRDLKGVKESFLCWCVPLLTYLGIVRGEEKEFVKWSEEEKHTEICSSDLEFDDYIYDIHTRNSKSNRDVKYETFAQVGAFVENEAEWTDSRYRSFYNFTKGVMDGKLTESKSEESKSEESKSNVLTYEKDVFQLYVRAQLVTSQNKYDTYFATDKLTGEFVLVKGPYPCDSSPVNENYQHFKKENGLNTIEYTTYKLIPNMWDKTALGYRNKIKKHTAYIFVAFKSVIPKSDVKIKIHQSKLWEPTEVADIPNYSFTFDMLKRSSENIHREYVENLLYRYIFSLSDIADRNFLVVNDKVYSVDEEHTGLKLASELKKNKCIYLKKWVSNNYNTLRLDWKSGDSDIKNKIEKLKNKEFVESLFTES